MTTSYKFTTLGIIVVGCALWVFSQSATGEARSMFNLLLLTLLVSMILLNWANISPLFFKQA